MVRSRFLGFTAAGLLLGGSMAAQATRVWVSGVGDDANPCSRTAPCKTFAGAISKVVAGGEMDALDAAGFGALTITKAITIDGGGGQVASVLVSGTPAFTIAAGANDVVTLRNLRINGIAQGTVGVNVVSAGAVHLEKCNVFGFTGNGISFQPSGSADLYVVDSQVSDNGGDGLYAVATGSNHSAVSVFNSHFDGNQNGVHVDTLAAVTVANSSASGNKAAGYLVAPTSSTGLLTLTNSVASVNVGPSLQASGSAVVYLAGSILTASTVSISVATPAVVISSGNNTITGTGSPTSTAALK